TRRAARVRGETARRRKMSERGKMTREGLDRHRRLAFEGVLRIRRARRDAIERVHPEWMAEWLKDPEQRRVWLNDWVLDPKTDRYVSTYVEKPESGKQHR